MQSFAWARAAATHRSRALARNANLGYVYQALGARDRARATWQRAIGVYEAALPAGDPERTLRVGELTAELAALTR